MFSKTRSRAFVNSLQVNSEMSQQDCVLPGIKTRAHAFVNALPMSSEIFQQDCVLLGIKMQARASDNALPMSSEMSKRAFLIASMTLLTSLHTFKIVQTQPHHLQLLRRQVNSGLTLERSILFLAVDFGYAINMTGRNMKSIQHPPSLNHQPILLTIMTV